MDMHAYRIGNILYGSRKDVSIEMRGLGRAIFNKMNEFKHNVLQIDANTGVKQTYGEVNKKLVRIALAMQGRGIKSGDVILSCSYNSMDTILPVYSTLYLNAVTVTLDPSITLRDSARLLEAVSPKLVFVVPEAVDLIENTIANLKEKPEIIVMGLHSKYVTLSEFLEPHPDEDRFIPKDVEDMHDVSVIFFSSGTTGLPKPIMHSNYSMSKTCELLRTVFSFETTFFYTSFYWISAFLFMTTVILTGTKRIYYNTFTPATFMKIIEKYKVTCTFLSPTFAMQFTEENTRNYNTESFKDFICGGSTITETLVANIWKCFPNTKFRVGYGQTEIAGIISVFTGTNDDLHRKKPASSGLPYLNMIIKIADLETGKPLDPMKKGEIRFKCDTVLRGYMNTNYQPEDLFDSEGFLKSGDIGYYDEDNCIYICDRIKEMFKYQGWHVVPASIEAIIYKHPAVLEAVVIGVPHKIDDHHPLALVVLKEGYSVTEDELLAFVNGKVSDRENLRGGLKIVKKLLKTPTGKLARPKIRQVILEGNLHQLTY
ncbi:hypothetical protein Trydic_g16121 [Trypoxylus dichotomus]